MRTPTRRPTRSLITGAVALVAILSLSSCNPTISWRVGATHGAIVEVGAARASVGIWRAPSRALYDVHQASGINVVQNLLCSNGNFPPLRLAVGDASISADVLKGRWCGYVNGDDDDLRGALLDAQAGSRDDCLAVTLISHGAYIKNWTYKDTGCQTGSLS